MKFIIEVECPVTGSGSEAPNREAVQRALLSYLLAPLVALPGQQKVINDSGNPWATDVGVARYEE